MLKLMKTPRRTNHRRILKAPTTFAADNLDAKTEVRKLFERFWRQQRWQKADNRSTPT